VLEIGFQISFITTAAGFQHGFGPIRTSQKPWKPANKCIKQFLLNRVKKIFFDLKSWGPLKNFKTRSGPYLALGLSITVKKQNENLAGLAL
jgi:hypothetical protein